MSERLIAVAIASDGLPGAAAALPAQPLDDGAWKRLGFEVTTQKLTGLLLDAVRGDRMPVTDAQYELASHWHEEQVATALRLERLMLRVVPALTDHGLDVLVLKGPAVAHLAYRDPSLRLFGDIDVLLRAEQFDDAMGRLEQDLGFDRPWAQMRPGFDARFGKGATLRAPEGLELDVHRTFVFGAFGLAVDNADLFDSPARFEVGGRSLLTLDPATRFLHACYHAALGSPTPRLMTLRDVVEQLPGGVDEVERVLDLVRRWRGRAVVARAVRLVERRFDMTLAGPIVEDVRGYVATPQEERAVAAQVGPGASFARQVVAALPYVEGLADRAAFLAAVLLPSSSSMASRESGGRLAWLRRGAGSLRGGARS